ncbi:hypothetical protein VKT23_010220 [Stygiomarasmius scandens]|uniref:Ubiquitin-like domain-containing protein n=1 Tax=Marasmiellus scandens TaxID=2682957 RepID=A0ABR1JCC6_9AGAR
MGSAYNLAFNSTTVSACTSLTRRPLGEEEIARREEERQRMEQEGRERSKRETGTEVQEEARPEASSTDAPAELTTEPSSVPVVPAAESQAQVQITMEPKIPLTFLLITGARRSMSFDPETTVGRVKELIWGGWPEEFPASDKLPTPSYLRLLHLGKILQDEDTLTRLKFPSYTPSYSSPTAPPPPSTSPTEPAPSAPSSPTSATSPSSLPIPAPMPLTIIHLSIRPHGPGIPPLSEDGNGLPKKKGMSIRKRSCGVQVPPLSLAVFNSNNNNGNGPTSPTSPNAGEAQLPTQGQGQGQVGVVGTTGLEGGVAAAAVVSSSAPAPPVDTGDEHGRSRGGGCCVIC